MKIPLVIKATALLATVSACGGHDPSGPSTSEHDRHPVAIEIVAGAAQTGAPGMELSTPLVIRVVDGRGRGVAGAPLHWMVVGGGVTTPIHAATDPSGRAETRWRLGSSGAQAVSVQVIGAPPSATFQAVIGE